MSCKEATECGSGVSLWLGMRVQFFSTRRRSYLFFSIHERSAREKISADQVAHVLNDEVSRKYIQSLKRCVILLPGSFLQQLILFQVVDVLANEIPTRRYFTADGMRFLFAVLYYTVYVLCYLFNGHADILSEPPGYGISKKHIDGLSETLFLLAFLTRLLRTCCWSC